jgi:hypothetical protein
MDNHIDRGAVIAGATPRPVRLSARPMLASASTSSADAWISTIKGIAVCWAIVAFIWIFFRIMAGARFCCQLCMYRHTSLNLSPPASITNSRPQANIDATTAAQRYALLSGLRHQENKIVNITDHRNNYPPPEYANFLPPSYDQVMELENLTMSTSFAHGQNHSQLLGQALRPTI